MKYHLKNQNGIAICGAVTDRPDTFLFNVDGFKAHYSKENECKKCAAILAKKEAAAATPSPLPETGKQVITRNGEVLPMNETETEVFHFGTWKEIQEDQDGELYIMGGLNSIYIDYLTPVQKPTPSANELESSEMERAIGDETVGNEREGFTGGEWKIAMSGEQVWAANKNTVCTLANYLPEYKANARLIASAPKLYYALKEVMEQDHEKGILKAQTRVKIKTLLNSIVLPSK